MDFVKTLCFISLICCSTLQELMESGKPEAPAMDVLTFLQQPVERIQTYQALLKVSMQFYEFFFNLTMLEIYPS